MAYIENKENAISVREKINQLYQNLEDFKRKINTKLDVASSSYQVFMSATSGDALDSAFGKGNEDNIYGIGKALSMFAWANGENETPFTYLCQIDNLEQLTYESCAEIIESPSLIPLFKLSEYADTYLYSKFFEYYPATESSANLVVRNNTLFISNSIAYNYLVNKTKLLTGQGEYIVNKDKYILVLAIGGGGAGGCCAKGQTGWETVHGAAGGSGYFQQEIIKVTKNENILYEVGVGGKGNNFKVTDATGAKGGNGGVTKFGNIVCEGGEGGNYSIQGSTSSGYATGGLGGVNAANTISFTATASGYNPAGKAIEQKRYFIKVGSVTGQNQSGNEEIRLSNGCGGFDFLDGIKGGNGLVGTSAKAYGGYGYGASGAGGAARESSSSANSATSGDGAPGAIFILD